MKRIIQFCLGTAIVLFAMIQAEAGLTNSVYWDFSNGGVSPTSNSFSGLTVTSLLQGNNNGTTALLTPTSASTAYTTAAGFSNSGSTNAGAAARTGALDFGATGSAYFEFSLILGLASPVSYSITNISFGSRQTGTGPTLISLYDSADGFATSNFVGSVSVLANSAWAASAFAGISINLPNDGSSTTFRLYGSGGTGSATAGTANWRMDDLAVALSPVIVPEPSTLALATIGGFACFFALRRKR